MDDLINCPVCMEVFELPRMLPCQHTFCEKCLSLHMKKSRVKERRRKFGCPLCRRSFVSAQEPFDGSTFPLNRIVVDMTYLSKMKEETASKDDKVTKSAKIISCDSHENVNAGYICTTHYSLVCDTCHENHCARNRNICQVLPIAEYISSFQYKQLKSSVLEGSNAVVGLYDTIQENTKQCLLENERKRKEAHAEISDFRERSLKCIRELIIHLETQTNESADTVKDNHLVQQKNCDIYGQTIERLRSSPSTEINSELSEILLRRKTLADVLAPLETLAKKELVSSFKVELPTDVKLRLGHPHNKGYVMKTQSKVKDEKIALHLAAVKHTKCIINEEQATEDVNDIDGRTYSVLLAELNAVDKFVITGLMSSKVSFIRKLFAFILFIYFIRVYIVCCTWHPLVSGVCIGLVIADVFLRYPPRANMRLRPTYICYRLLEHVCRLSFCIIYLFPGFLILIKYFGAETLLPQLKGSCLNLQSCSFEEWVLASLLGHTEVLALKTYIKVYHRSLDQYLQIIEQDI